VAARSFSTIATTIGQPIVSILEPICQPPFTAERVAACAQLSAEKTAKAEAERSGSLIGSVIQPLVSAVGSFLLPGSGLLTGVVSKVAAPPRLAPFVTSGIPLTTLQPGGTTMAFEDGDSSGFTLPTLGDINTILQGPLGRGLLDIGTTFARVILSHRIRSAFRYRRAQRRCQRLCVVGRSWRGRSRSGSQTSRQRSRALRLAGSQSRDRSSGRSSNALDRNSSLLAAF